MTTWKIRAELGVVHEPDLHGTRSMLAAYADSFPVSVGSLVGRVFRITELVDNRLTLVEVTEDSNHA